MRRACTRKRGFEWINEWMNENLNLTSNKYKIATNKIQPSFTLKVIYSLALDKHYWFSWKIWVIFLIALEINHCSNLFHLSLFTLFHFFHSHIINEFLYNVLCSKDHCLFPGKFCWKLLLTGWNSGWSLFLECYYLSAIARLSFSYKDFSFIKKNCL